MSEIPKKLYHYTSVEALKSILTYQTIRFSPLSKVDDLQEEKARDAVALGKRVLVSSWCADEHENLPMWDRYAGQCTGVRISLPVKPFRKYHYTANDLLKYPYVVTTPDFEFDTFIPLKDILNPEYVVTPYNWKTNILYPVIYTDDEAYLYPNLITTENGYMSIEFHKLGKHKNTLWKYQNEWRYILIVYPYSMIDIQRRINNPFEVRQMCEAMLNGTAIPGLDYYDIVIDPACFSQMEITLGAKMSVHEKREISNYIKVKNPCARIMESEFVHSLR